MPILEPCVVAKHFEEMLKNTLPEVLQEVDIMNGRTIQQFTKTGRNNRMFDFSNRKELNRSVQLFENMNIVDYFQKYINQTIQLLKQNNLVPNFTNQNHVTNMETVLEITLNVQN